MMTTISLDKCLPADDIDRMGKYIVVIGGIVASRHERRRAHLQDRLRSILQSVNGSSSSVVSPYTVTLGAECQAVLNCADSLFQDIMLISKELHPVRMRFAIGLGEIATEINRSIAIGMDGEAFYAARTGLEELKRGDMLLSLRGLSGSCADLVSAGLALVSASMSNWTSNRLGVLLGLLRDESASRIAKGLGISRQAVYQNRDRGKMPEVMDVLIECRRLISRELSTGES
jgi:hypothetical protein